MVDKIDKLKLTEPWKIQEANPSKKDKRNQSDEEKQEDAKSSFEESQDWNRFIAKDSGGSGTLLTRDVKGISFKHAPTAADEEKAKMISQASKNTKWTSSSASIPSFQNNTELILLVITGILLLVLIYLIIKIFI